MTKNHINIAIVPARGGSKGVPLKNIRLVSGKPLIALAIECGLKCNLIDHVVISTESQQIANVASEWGGEVFFLRPEELAQDTTPMLPVLEHALLQAEKHYQKKVQYVFLLDPTAPLREVQDIASSLELIIKHQCDAVISGSPAHRNPYFNMVMEKNGQVELVCSSNEAPVYRRQDAPAVYDLNTVAWVFSRHAILEEKARIPKKTRLLIIPNERSIDLDTEEDFQYLEYLLNKKAKGRN